MYEDRAKVVPQQPSEAYRVQWWRVVVWGQAMALQGTVLVEGRP